MRWQAGKSELNERELKTGVDAAPSVEAKLRVDLIVILDHASHLDAFVLVQGMFKQRRRR